MALRQHLFQLFFLRVGCLKPNAATLASMRV
jgi:hypothetical protein